MSDTPTVMNDVSNEPIEANDVLDDGSKAHVPPLVDHDAVRLSWTPLVEQTFKQNRYPQVPRAAVICHCVDQTRDRPTQAMAYRGRRQLPRRRPLPRPSRRKRARCSGGSGAALRTPSPDPPHNPIAPQLCTRPRGPIRPTGLGTPALPRPGQRDARDLFSPACVACH